MKINAKYNANQLQQLDKIHKMYDEPDIKNIQTEKKLSKNNYEKVTAE